MSIFDEECHDFFDDSFDYNRDGYLDPGERAMQSEYIANGYSWESKEESDAYDEEEDDDFYNELNGDDDIDLFVPVAGLSAGIASDFAHSKTESEQKKTTEQKVQQEAHVKQDAYAAKENAPTPQPNQKRRFRWAIWPWIFVAIYFYRSIKWMREIAQGIDVGMDTFLVVIDIIMMLVFIYISYSLGKRKAAK